VNEETAAVEDVGSGAETHDNVQSFVTQQGSTGVASCSTDDNLMRHIEDSQRIAISVMCTTLNISAGNLLAKDVTTHNEFMKVLADVAISVNEYFELSTVWKGHQSFSKKNSSVSVKHSNVEKSIQSLKAGLVG